jgi:hypothetical protein
MKGMVAIGALICLGAFIVAGKPYEGAEPDKRPPQQEVSTAPTSNGAHNPDTHTQKAGDNAPDWHAAIKRSDWWLVVAAFATLGIVCWQAVEMAKATRVMERSTKASEEGIVFMIEKERARLVVEIDPLELWSSDDIWKVGIKVVNHGATKAFIRDARFLPCVEGLDWKPIGADIYLVMKLPAVISPDLEAHPDGPIQNGVNITRECWDIDVETARAVYNDERKLFVFGFIDYDDIFGNGHRHLFSQVWRPMFVKDGLPTHSEWDKYLPQLNRDERIEKQEAAGKKAILFKFPPN